MPLVPFCDALVANIRSWLATNIPDWANFSIRGSAKYLGFYLGPAAGKHQWVAPINKFRDRVKAIGATDCATALAVYSYNVRTVPVLSYVGQLCMLPNISPNWEGRDAVSPEDGNERVSSS